MRFHSLKIDGYKRFASGTVVYLRARAVAAIGANEAGKTTLLDAFANLSSSGWNSNSEFTDRLPPSDPRRVILSARFRLEEADVEAVEQELDGRPVSGEVAIGATFSVTKEADGKRYLSLNVPLRRNIRKRQELDARLGSVLEAKDHSPLPLGNLDDEGASLREVLRDARATTVDDREDLASGEIQPLAKLDAHLTSLAGTLSEEDAFLNDLRSEVAEVLSEEKKEAPLSVARDLLFNRMPTFVQFGPGDRELESFHSFDDQPPAGLLNLLAAGRGNYDTLRELATDPERRTELRDAERAISGSCDVSVGGVTF